MAEMKENMAPATAPPARTSDIAVIGLAVMGQNLILNMNDNGFVVTAYNRTTAKVDEFLANEAKGTRKVHEVVREPNPTFSRHCVSPLVGAVDAPVPPGA